MDGERFDAIARRMTTSSRRGALRLLAGGAAGALLARLAPAGVAAQEAQAVCRFVGEPCRVNVECCRGARCQGGTCQCRPNHTNCNGRCRDLRSNERHCGACNTPCEPGRACCRRRCVDPATDPAHCGRCGRACRADQSCDGGACACPAGSAECGGACKGGGSAPCTEDEQCCSGACFLVTSQCCPVCPAGCDCGFADGPRCTDRTGSGQDCFSTASCPPGEACFGLVGPTGSCLKTCEPVA